MSMACRAGCCCGHSGDVIYFMPPYVITEDEIRFMAEVATEGIERATAQ